MVGDLATPVGPHHLGPHGGRVDQHVLGPAPHAEGEDVGVLHQQEVVVAAPPPVEGPLHGQGVAVAHPTEPSHPEHGDRR